MPSDEDWEELDPDIMMRSERKHEWISEPKYKRMFDDIEHALQGVMGRGPFEWVDRRVFDQVFDRSTLLALHKLMEKGEIETIDHPIARGKEAHVFRATSATGPPCSRASRGTSTATPGSRGYPAGTGSWSTSGSGRSSGT
jgi:hypothetical protein